MMRIFLITVLFALSVILYGVSEWFKVESSQIASINKRHQNEIEKLKKIAKINMWLEHHTKSYFQQLPQTSESGDKELVTFYDKYATEFNFKINRFIYSGEGTTHNLDLSFFLERSLKKEIEELVVLHYRKGFLKFSRFEVTKDKISGTLKIVQPYFQKDINVSYK